jgi:hypothetical protein
MGLSQVASIAVMGMFVTGAQGAAAAEALYKSPIPDTMNVRFVENHIVIDRPADAVFDWVTTWGNLPKWLPVTAEVRKVSGGPIDKPSHIGDVLIEVVPAKVAAAPGQPAVDRLIQYTVVEQQDGFLWTVAGQNMIDGKPANKIEFIATYTVKALPGGNTLFSREFHSIRPNEVNPVRRTPVDDPVLNQAGLEKLKSAIEVDLPR